MLKTRAQQLMLRELRLKIWDMFHLLTLIKAITLLQVRLHGPCSGQKIIQNLLTHVLTGQPAVEVFHTGIGAYIPVQTGSVTKPMEDLTVLKRMFIKNHRKVNIRKLVTGRQVGPQMATV